VLTIVPIYILIALDLPKWVLGGNCLVAWEKVKRPVEYGGLGIHNL